MNGTTRISRRTFLKLSAALGGALAVSGALPALAAAEPSLRAARASALPSVAASGTIGTLPSTTAGDAGSSAHDLPHPTAIRFGTPTDVAATWFGEAWSVDANGAIHRFDHTTQAWLPDEADAEANFPLNSRFVVARWGRPTGASQMLMVLSGDHRKARPVS